MRGHVWIFGLAVLAAAAIGGVCRGADYEIRLQRPFKAGQLFGLSSIDAYRASETIDAPNSMGARSSTLRRIALEAEVRVDKVDEQGLPLVQSVTVTRLSLQNARSEQDMASPPRTLLESGTQLTMTYEKNNVAFALKGGRLTDETLGALQQGFKRFSLSDGVYGSKERREVGASWPINKGALPGKNDPGYVDPALITGTVSVKALRTLAGVECLQLDGTTTTRDVPIAGVMPKEATATEIFSCTLPTAADLPVLAWSLKSTTRVVTEDKRLGRTVVRTAESEISHEATWTPKR